MNTFSPPNPDLCPRANICAVTTFEGPACGISLDQLPELPLGEELCPEAALGLVAILRRASHNQHPLALGSALLDAALCHDNANVAEELFTEAEATLTRATYDSHPSDANQFRAQYNAYVLLSYWPFFTKRMDEDYPTIEDFEATIDNLSDMDALISQPETPTESYNSTCKQTALMQAALRQQVPLMPSNGRENRSRGRSPSSPMRHTLYGYRLTAAGPEKAAPMQISNRRRRPPVLRVPGIALIEAAAVTAGVDRAITPQQLLAGIRQETDGGELPGDIASVLEATGTYLGQIVRGELRQGDIIALAQSVQRTGSQE